MSVASAILALSPSSYWKLDEASGNFADSAGSVTGTPTVAPTYNEAPITPGDTTGKSALFNVADGDRISFGDVYNFTGAAQFTALCFLKPRVWSANTIWSNTDGAAHGWALRAVTSGTWRMYRGDAAGWNQIDYTGMSEATYESGAVFMIAMRYDGTNLILNINGVDVVSGASAKTMTNAVTNLNLAFGAYTGGGGGYDGWADDLAIFSTALTEAQLLGIYNAGFAVTQELRPDADTVTTGWSTEPLFSKLDEVVAGGDVITATAS